MNILKVFQKQSQQLPPKIFNPDVPSGLIAETEKGFFYIKGKKRFKFVSKKAMQTWNLPVVKTLESKLTGFPIMGTLGLRDGTVAKDISDSKIYLISDSKKRHIVNPDVLLWINSSIIEVSQKDILIHTDGDPLEN